MPAQFRWREPWAGSGSARDWPGRRGWGCRSGHRRHHRRPVYHVIETNQWGVWLFSWLYVTAIVLIGMGLHPLLRHWTGPTLTLLFVALNFTSSGGIFCTDLATGDFLAGSTRSGTRRRLAARRPDHHVLPRPKLGWDVLKLVLAGPGRLADGTHPCLEHSQNAPGG